MIRVKTTGLSDLQKYLTKTGAKRFKVAQTMWVNRAAFGTRKNAIKYIDVHMTVRNPQFVQSRIRVKKASVSRRVAEAGSVRTARFTGWAEQERLVRDKRDKVLTPEARMKSRTKRVPPKYRMKRTRKYRRPEDYPGRTRRARAQAMLQAIGRGRDKKAFVLHGHPVLKSGLWRFGNGPKGRRELIPIQLFRTDPKEPRKQTWMRSSAKRYFDTINSKSVWADLVRRVKADRE